MNVAFIAALAALGGAVVGGIATVAAARLSSRGTVGAAAKSGADAYGMSVRQTRMDAYQEFAKAARLAVSQIQDAANSVGMYSSSIGEDERRGEIPSLQDLLTRLDPLGDAAIRVRLAGPKVVAEEAYAVLETCSDALGNLESYIGLVRSSPFMSVDSEDLTIITEGPLIRYREVAATIGSASNTVAKFLDVARDHLDDWNGSPA
ncbi:hypothetical protein [Streptomyces vietnamensis]|uniref:hypothetical protein n=1 Tax=Streptomyces vietnamensis TaxID=362257 RepID=UPI00131CB442|nr:hypothetical protein [Streptomyces vietnamensis]